MGGNRITIEIETQLENARQNLLDLTMRNKLLNFRPSKRRTIQVIDEIPREIYDILVLQEKKMNFLPIEKIKIELNDSNNESQDNDVKLDFLISEESIVWKLPDPDAVPEDRHIDSYLQTQLNGENLQRQLFYIYQQSRSVLEEQGYTVLYLALGFLEWKESPNSDINRIAPLILVPVELDRTEVRALFNLKWTGEDIFTNISLQAKLLEQGIKLPDFEMPDDKKGFDKYFKSVADAISEQLNWRVTNEIYLGFFSFTKFVMYKDLDPAAWPKGMSPAQHHLIKEIFDPSDKVSYDKGFDENEIDEKLRSRNLYHVKDADPSQIAVIEDVKMGRNLVVEGPPGTGKSQTITNIIAELLAQDKKVLFVSEKMAALEVVKNRLDNVGLGDFCIELHSRKTNKKEFLKELKRTIELTPSKARFGEEDFVHLESLKTDLNNYAKVLREPIGALRIPPYTLFGRYEIYKNYFNNVGRKPPNFRFTDPEKIDQKMKIEAEQNLSNLKAILLKIKSIKNHPWRGTNPGLILPQDQMEIETLLNESINLLNIIRNNINDLANSLFLSSPHSISDIQNTINATKIIIDLKPVNKIVLLNPNWNNKNEVATALIHNINRFQTDIQHISLKFKEEALHQNINEITTEFDILSKKMLKVLSGRYRKMRSDVFNLYKTDPPRDDELILKDLKYLANFISLRKEIKSKDTNGKELFDIYWKGENSKIQELEDFMSWIISFRKYVLKGIITQKTIDNINTGRSTPQINDLIQKSYSNIENFKLKINKLSTKIKFNLNKIFNSEFDRVSLTDINSKLELWLNNIEEINNWANYIKHRNKCIASIAKPLIGYIDNNKLPPNDFIHSFRLNLYSNLLNIAFQQRPELSNFDSSIHENLIEEFSKLDKKIINRNRLRLKSKLDNLKPDLSPGASKGSEAGILQEEFARKRGHRPIRRLMIETGSLIQKIKPCFMMSPLSIAQFLDPKTTRFDVIIFDEASQVKPEDALGAILRGNRLVIMGDTKQLPPTTFFDHIVESTDEDIDDYSATVSDIESILHLCENNFPTKVLNWHYRSRHESLIAVSNQEFYDNKLLIYPSPIDKSDNLGLKFNFIPDSIYDRGRSSINRKEAKIVAEKVFEHYRKFPEKSLGVGTFNMKQQNAINEEIEIQRQENPDMEPFFNPNRYEHFFVKNLETIQGDERDVIFVSVAYGKDENGRLTQNFGPVNHEGGQRRLNVLVTRAREKCIVFSNFKWSDLSIKETTPFGVKALKVFLEYAETRNLKSVEKVGKDTESPFEDSVYEFLINNNYIVKKQVGCAGFRIDLAIVDPESPGRYIIAIECDGAKYHSSRVARDRDRLRQQILEGLGWKIHRIWSTDWFKNRKNCERELLSAIENAKNPSEIKKKQTKRPLIKTKVNPKLKKRQTIDKNKKPSKPEIEWEEESNFIQKYTEPYYFCNNIKSININFFPDLLMIPWHILSSVIIEIVNIEGPIRTAELIKRIRTFWGLKRAGSNIQYHVSGAIESCIRNGPIAKRDDFLFIIGKKVHVRHRTDKHALNIHLISNEEIAKAIKLVLKIQFATYKDSLIVQSSRVLGFKKTSKASIEIIGNVIDILLRKRILIEKPNKMIDLLKK